MSKFLDKEGVSLLWSKVKNLIKTSVDDKLGEPNGSASLDSNGKLETSQLPDLKTINGESIVGEGNITIDLNIYQIVESLPSSDQNPNKIYLVLSGTQGEQNIYTEWIWVNNAWEKLGEYIAKVDLADYVKEAELEEKIKESGEFVTFDDVVTIEKNGLVDKKYNNLLPSLYTGRDMSTDPGSEDGNYTVKVNALQSVTIVKKGISWALCLEGIFDDKKSNDKLYRTLPSASSSEYGLMSYSHYNKLQSIDEKATADSAIPTTELEEIFV